MVKNAVVKKSAKMAVNSWQEQLAAAAQDVLATESGGGGNYLNITNGRLTYQGMEFPGNKVDVIVVDAVYANTYYDRPYNPDDTSSPVCYAFGLKEAELAPHAQCSQAQNPQCSNCLKNAYKTAANGKGKACSNTRRLLLLTPDMLGNLEAAQPLILKVSPTNTRSWGGYAQQLAGVFKRPPYSVVTQISVVADPKTQFHINFTKLENIDDGAILFALDAMQKRTREAGALVTPYPEVVVEAPPPAAKKTPAKKYTK